MAASIEAAEKAFDEGLSDDLNTAQALAAAFDLIRETNITMDNGKFRSGDIALLRGFLAKFDSVFALLEDNDSEKLRALGYGGEAGGLSDTEIEKLIAERIIAKQKRDFAAADRIRKELADRGIMLEDTKDGRVRWKRK